MIRGVSPLKRLRVRVREKAQGLRLEARGKAKRVLRYGGFPARLRLRLRAQSKRLKV